MEAPQDALQLLTQNMFEKVIAKKLFCKSHLEQLGVKATVIYDHDRP